MLLKRTKSLVATFLYALVLAVPLLAFAPAAVSSAAPVVCVNEVVDVPAGAPQEAIDHVCDDKGGLKPAAGSAAKPETTTVKNDCQGDNIHAGGTGDDHCQILNYIRDFINVLSAAVGIVIVGSLIYAGIEYTMSGSDAQKVSNAKNRIRNAIIALVTFLFFFSFLQWLVPGGIY